MGSQDAQLRRSGALPPLGPGPVDVLGVGENSVDVLVSVPHFPSADEKVEMTALATCVGGQVASALVACTRLGRTARYLGSFGDDANGRLAWAALERAGVDLGPSRRVAGANRTAVVLVDTSGGTRTVIGYRETALRWPVEDIPVDLATGARVVLLDATDLGASVAVALQARAGGVPVMLDVDEVVDDIDALLSVADVVVAAKGFAERATGLPRRSDAMAQLVGTFDLKCLVVTLGSAGAVAWQHGREVLSPAFDVRVVDTTGAGDAFRGGFLAAWLEADRPPTQGHANANVDFEEVLRQANAVAAMNCLAVGAQVGLPNREALETFLATHVTNQGDVGSKESRAECYRSES